MLDESISRPITNATAEAYRSADSMRIERDQLSKNKKVIDGTNLVTQQIYTYEIHEIEQMDLIDPQ